MGDVEVQKDIPTRLAKQFRIAKNYSALATLGVGRTRHLCKFLAALLNGECRCLAHVVFYAVDGAQTTRARRQRQSGLDGPGWRLVTFTMVGGERGIIILRAQLLRYRNQLIDYTPQRARFA